MPKSLWFVAVLLLLALPAAAQETPKAEFFAGYSYFRPEGGGINMHGWNAAIAGNVNQWFSIVGDFSGNYENDINMYLFTFGPRLNYRTERVNAFTHVLLGGAKLAVASVSDSGFAMVLGGGVDVQVNEKVAIRIFQTDYVMERTWGESSNDLRFSAGINFRFGSK